MRPVDMIAIDLDDTLLRDDISISEYTGKVLRKAGSMGIRIVVATGRMFQAARPWGKILHVGDVPMVVYTGALTATCETGQILLHETLDLDTANEILAEGKKHGWYMQAYVNDTLLVPAVEKKTKDYEVSCGIHAEVRGEAFWHLEEAPTKLLIFEEDPQVMEEASRYMTARFSGQVGHVKSKPYFYEMHRMGVSKGHALEMLCLRWGIPLSRVMTFGNSENDLSMLSVTPWSFAVENAEPAVKEEARYLTDSNNHDGVAKAVARYVLEA